MRDRILLALDDDANAAQDGDPVPDDPAEPAPAAIRAQDRAEATGPATRETGADHPTSPAGGRTAPAGPAPRAVPHGTEADATRGTGRSPSPAAATRAGRRTPTGTTRPAAARGQRGPGDARRGVLTGVRGRFAVAAVAVLALVGALTGMSVLLSRDALPGDALYGVKRTAEAAELGLTFGDEPKALKHLEFAASRISEIETLARRYPDPGDAPVGGYLTALTDFENDAAAGSRQLIALATSTDGRLLASLGDWATQQADRLRAIRDHLPAAAYHRESATRALLEKIIARAEALDDRMDCSQITSGSSDDIGALPAGSECRSGPAPSPSTSRPTASTSTVPTGPPAPATGPEVPDQPLPSAEPTADTPPLPVPGATVSVPLPTPGQTPPPTGETERPPLISLPPLLPGLPGVGIG
jgi:hypothetical protein